MKLSFKRSSSLFFSLLLLTGVFFLAEVSFFLQCNRAYFTDFRFITHHLQFPLAVLPGILFFIFAQIILHVAYTGFIWIAVLATAAFYTNLCKAYPRHTQALPLPQSIYKWGVFLWLLGLITLFSANQYFFPNSKFAELSRFLFSDRINEFLLYVLSGVWLSIWVITSGVLLAYLTWKNFFWSMTTVVLLSGYFFYKNYLYVTTDASTQDKPNIILIGVDSLRPDFLSMQKTIFFRSFLRQSTVFTHAFTPLARTYPSWISILSGKYPKESGIRFNLSAQDPKNKQSFLPFLLHDHGYKTLFAMDETRFSNMDKRFGFDEMITPPMGLNDFLLGTFNDFPLSNMLVNTVIGKWLFPYSYANRPAYVTYNPDTFLSLMDPYLKQSRYQPLFLAVHFCITHHPYVWGGYWEQKDKEPQARYLASISRVDRQLTDFMNKLERYQILRHAIVVLLSDHGEALELLGDRITAPLSYIPADGDRSQKIPRFYPPSIDKEAVDQSAGHGTDVLGFSQYRTLLAFRLYGLGLKKQSMRSITSNVLLLDIKPTLLQFLGIPDVNSGVSLKKVIEGQSAFVAERPNLFLESDFSPMAIRTVHPETRKLVLEGVDLFTIDPYSTHIYVKPSMGKLIISSKQYADIDRDWVLALYPQDKGKVIPVLVHLSTGKWTTDLHTAFAKHSPSQHMLYALRQFYGKEVTY